MLGSRALPPASTALGRELRAWRASLVQDLGGADAVSTQQLALIEKAVTQKFIRDSIDAYVLQMASLVNKRNRTLWPVVRERAAQVALLQSLLRDLGLERRAKPVADMAYYLAERSTQSAPSGATAPGEPRELEVPALAAGSEAPGDGSEPRPPAPSTDRRD